MVLSNERSVAVQAVLEACRVCQSVQDNLVSESTLAKKDKSPVTVADFGAQALVSRALVEAFPADPLVGEEDAAALRTPENAELCAKVVAAVRDVAPSMDEAQVLAAIDRGTHAGGAKGRIWTLDPIDGTLGFLRKEQYAVALALLVDGEVVLGVLGCPNLELDASGKRGALFVAVKGEGAFMRGLDDATERPIRVSSVADPKDASFTESVEAGHSSHGDAANIAALLGVTAPSVRMDSQAKYAAVARGDASIYLRLPTRKGYEEKIWDHAAGVVVIEEAGGEVSDVRGKALDFSIGRTLRDNAGVIATNGALHERVVAAVREVLEGAERQG